MPKSKVFLLCPLGLLTLFACAPDGPSQYSPTAPKVISPGGACGATCDLITDSRPFRTSRSSPDSASGSLFLAKVILSGTRGATVSLGITADKHLVAALPRDSRILVTVADEKEQSFAVSALASAPATIYRFEATSRVGIRYSLSRGSPISIPVGDIRLTQYASSAEVDSSERWWIRARPPYAANLSTMSNCVVAAAYSNTCGIYVQVLPFASGGLGGTFQSNSGTGASQPIWISFTAPGATSVTITVYDPTYPGNGATAWDVGGNFLGSVGFTGTGIPGFNVPDTQTLPYTDIRSIQLVPADADYVSYDVSFAGVSVAPPCAASPLASYDGVSDPFGQIDTSHVSPHLGRDYAVISGTQVFAQDSGTIVWSSLAKGAGYAMVLRSALPDSRGLLLDTYFFHLQGPAPGIHLESVVHAGQLIAISDNTGHTTGAHLHFEQHVQDTWLGEPDPHTPFPASHVPRSTAVVPCTF